MSGRDIACRTGPIQGIMLPTPTQRAFLAWFGAKLLLLVVVAGVFASRGAEKRGAQMLCLLSLGSSATSLVMAMVALARRSSMAGPGWTEWDEVRAFTLFSLLAYMAYRAIA